MHTALEAACIRVEPDLRNEEIGSKVRELTVARILALPVVSRREAERRQVAVRRPGDSARLVLAPGGGVSALATEAQPPNTTNTTN